MKKLIVVAVFFLFCGFHVFSADVRVQQFDLLSHGFYADSNIQVQSYADFSISIDGGYKFGGNLQLGLNTTSLSGSLEDSNLFLQSASATLQSPFSLPLDISYFVGQFDSLTNGDSFIRQFGTAQFSTRYRGRYYFYGTQPLYNGIHNIKGSGFAITSIPGLSDWIYGGLYIYKDSYIPDAYLSADGNLLLNFPDLKLEVFLGMSYPYSALGTYRGGLMFFYNAGDTGEFYAEIGTTHFDPSDNTADLYILFEPRVHLGPISIITTFFYQPGHYRFNDFEDTDNQGSIDLNLNLQYGRFETQQFQSGVETTVKVLQGSSTDNFSISFSPYMYYINSGVIWFIKANLNALVSDLTEIPEIFIGAKTEF